MISRGANPLCKLSLHPVWQCEDTEKLAVMTDHLLDRHRMDIEADNEDLRSFMPQAYDSAACYTIAMRRLS